MASAMTREEELEVARKLHDICGHIRLAETNARQGMMITCIFEAWQGYRKLRELLGVIAPMVPDT